MAEQGERILLPPPNFEQKIPMGPTPHFLTPSGMTLLPRDRQPPSMYGIRGATVAPRFLPPQPTRGQQKWPRHQHQETLSISDERQFCESCDMELQSSDDLRRHRSQHENCPVVGCKYRGHPSVMDKHITDLHTSGLFEKFKKLSTPEEIAAWREERRKKYPSLANVQMRQRAQEQRQKRGERLMENKSRFGRREDRRRAMNQGDKGNNESFGSKRKIRQRNRRDSKQGKKLTDGQTTDQALAPEAEVTCCNVPMFRGTLALETDQQMSATKSNALSHLLDMYGSDTEEEQKNDDHFDEEHIDCTPETVVEGASIQAIKPDMTEVASPQPEECMVSPAATHKAAYIVDCEQNKVNDSSDESPMEMPIIRCNDDSSNVPTAIEAVPSTSDKAKSYNCGRAMAQRTGLIRRSGLDYRMARLRKQNTMLEKLLESDIRHERNVLLQCIRFVCENDFFGLGTLHKN